MRIRLENIAEQLISEGFKSQEIDSEKLTNRVIEILGDLDLFTNLHDEMTLIEDENHPEPRTMFEYMERLGEF